MPSSTARSPRPNNSATKQVQQQYNDQLGIYVQEKNAHVQWERQVARRTTRIAQVVQRLDRVEEIEEADGFYAETKIEELAERKLRFDHVFAVLKTGLSQLVRPEGAARSDPLINVPCTQ